MHGQGPAQGRPTREFAGERVKGKPPNKCKVLLPDTGNPLQPMGFQMQHRELVNYSANLIKPSSALAAFLIIYGAVGSRAGAFLEKHPPGGSGADGLFLPPRRHSRPSVELKW